jgi:mitochondrial ornithine carrier protein
MDTKPKHHAFSASDPPVSNQSTTATSTASSKQPSSPVTEAFKDIAFGSIAGIAGKVVEYPFDTVKVRLQSQPDHLPLRYSGPLDCFRQSIQQDGFRGLYRGVSAPFAGAAAETACLFFSYRIAQQWLENVLGYNSDGSKLGMGGLLTAAAISGGVTSLILTPIELVKCRMQVPLQSAVDPTLSPHSTGLSTKPLSPFTVIADVYRREGLVGFWRGQLGTFLRETGGTAAWFGAYEASTLYLRTQLYSKNPNPEVAVSTIQLSIYQQMLSGALAGMSYNFFFYPADTIKSKIQTGELNSTGVKPTFSGVGRALWQTHGLKGLYRGCGITVARSAPSSALIFTIMEQLKVLFG